MRPDAYLINVARGPVVDEQALYTALRERRIAGAAIDVWYEYPPDGRGYGSRFPFQELDNVIMTPHVSGWTEGTVRRLEVAATNIRRVAGGLPPLNVVGIAPGRP
jgi:phosphoglycerate dehydrogenase-like enzyme